MFAIVVFVVILSFLVMLHEFGHFIAAKRSGIGVEEFGFGLPPRIWGKNINGTIYSINWLPFGGFVRLVGEDSTDEEISNKNSFQTKSLFVRIRVVLAGVFMNFVLAVVLFYILLFFKKRNDRELRVRIKFRRVSALHIADVSGKFYRGQLHA